MNKEQLDNIAQQISEVTIFQMFDTIAHQLEYATIDLDVDTDGDEYWDALEYATAKTINNIVKTLKNN